MISIHRIYMQYISSSGKHKPPWGIKIAQGRGNGYGVQFQLRKALRNAR